MNAESDADSTDSSLALRDWEKVVKKDGFDSIPSVEPFDADDPDLQVCFGTFRLSEVPIMLSGPGSLYECERRGRLAYWLWTREEAKALSKITFKFDNKLKARISKLCSSHSSSKQNRKILDEIFLSVAEQSPAMKKLWLSIYAGTLRVIPGRLQWWRSQK